MKNEYFRNLEKIEFVVTYACTGRCKHCSEGDHQSSGERVDPLLAANAVRAICKQYYIKTVMAFGGEPLLYPDAVYAIMEAAKEFNIPKRQVITNGFFTKDEEKMREVLKKLAECGVNDLLLSVDAFHQETIPLEVVKKFAVYAKEAAIPVRLQPAWLVSREDGNHYNKKTREVLAAFCDTGIPVGDGNVIFPEGNAKKYLGEYFLRDIPQNPYTEDPCNVKTVSFEPNGDVLGGNFYEKDIIEIINSYSV